MVYLLRLIPQLLCHLPLSLGPHFQTTCVATFLGLRRGAKTSTSTCLVRMDHSFTTRCITMSFNSIPCKMYFTNKATQEQLICSVAISTIGRFQILHWLWNGSRAALLQFACSALSSFQALTCGKYHYWFGRGISYT